LHLITKKSYARNLVAALLTTVGTLAACEEQAPGPPVEAPADTSASVESTCEGTGRLAGQFSGAINVQLDWSDDEMLCESMPRPDAEGVRLRFSGEISAERVAIIIALPALNAGATGDGFDSNVTITVENSGRFFSTPNLDTCWADIVTNEPLPDDAGVFKLVGSLSCVGPLGEINGDAFVDVRDLQFSGVANWSEQ
jgi:hypothetical protein